MPMNPHLANALASGLGGAALWDGVGALGGAMGAEKGHRGEGALHGGLQGAAIGGLTHGALGGIGSMASSAPSSSAGSHSSWESRGGHGDPSSHWSSYGETRTPPRWSTGDDPFKSSWDDFFNATGGPRTPPRSAPSGGSKAHADPFDPSQWGGHGAKARADAGQGYGSRARSTPSGGGAEEKWHSTDGQSWRSQGSRDAWEDIRKSRGSSGGGLGDVAPWMKDVKTKADAKSAFRAQARSNHPDHGGTDEAMKNINAQWDKVQAHPDFSKLGAAAAAGLGAARALARFGIR